MNTITIKGKTFKTEIRDGKEYIGRPTSETRDQSNETRTVKPTKREQILKRCGVIRYRDKLPSIFKDARCSFCCTNRTTRQVMFTAVRTKSGRIKPIAWQWCCGEHEREIGE